MMRSVRERIVTDVLARLAAAVAPAAVHRQPTTALQRASTPALVVMIDGDAPTQRSNTRMGRVLSLRIIALARDTTDGYAVADDLICKAHAALLTDPSLGGIAHGIEEGEADWQAEDADVDAIAIPAVYQIAYRTLAADITEGG